MKQPPTTVWGTANIPNKVTPVESRFSVIQGVQMTTKPRDTENSIPYISAYTCIVHIKLNSSYSIFYKWPPLTVRHDWFRKKWNTGKLYSKFRTTILCDFFSIQVSTIKVFSSKLYYILKNKRNVSEFSRHELQSVFNNHFNRCQACLRVGGHFQQLP